MLQFCNKQKILLFLILPHLTHLIQLLDVTCFQPFKHHYAQAIDQTFFLSCDDFDKLEFLNLIHDVRIKALKESTIKSAWKRAGLISYDSCLVIEPLKWRVRTPSLLPLPEQFPTPESATKLKTTIDSMWWSCPDLSGAPEFKFWLKKLARGSLGIAHAVSHLSTSLEATRAAEKR